MKLRCKTARVTGASGGIGAAVAEELAWKGGSVTVDYFRNETGARQVARQIGEAGSRSRRSGGCPAEG
jgi:3-oxoacyl-[acyl-carrier protein] reductase